MLLILKCKTFKWLLTEITPAEKDKQLPKYWVALDWLVDTADLAEINGLPGIEAGAFQY